MSSVLVRGPELLTVIFHLRAQVRITEVKDGWAIEPGASAPSSSAVSFCRLAPIADLLQPARSRCALRAADFPRVPF